MGCKHTGNADPKVFSLPAQAKKVVVGQLVDLEETAQLDARDPLLGQQPKQPLVGIPILDRIGLDPELKFQTCQGVRLQEAIGQPTVRLRPQALGRFSVSSCPGGASFRTLPEKHWSRASTVFRNVKCGKERY
jgi:hypothetical protein